MNPPLDQGRDLGSDTRFILKPNLARKALLIEVTKVGALTSVVPLDRRASRRDRPLHPFVPHADDVPAPLPAEPVVAGEPPCTVKTILRPV